MLEEVYNNETRFIELKSKSKIDTMKCLLISGRFLRELRKILKIAKALELLDHALGSTFRYFWIKKRTYKGKQGCILYFSRGIYV